MRNRIQTREKIAQDVKKKGTEMRNGAGTRGRKIINKRVDRRRKRKRMYENGRRNARKKMNIKSELLKSRGRTKKE